MRASLSISEPNESWIQEKIDSKEFSSRSEVVNDVLRRAREIEQVRAQLLAAEISVQQQGWVTQSQEAMLHEFKQAAKNSGDL